MKMKNNILILAVVAMAAMACTNDPTSASDVNVDVNRKEIAVGASGGVEKVKIEASGNWVASLGSNMPWVTISPANGRGSVTCDFIIDSALTINSRQGVVTIKHLDSGEERKITIDQSGYEYALEVDRTNVDVKKYAEYGKRYFDVTVKTNFAFKVVVPESAKSWISREESITKLPKSYKLDLNRGVRPREVKVRFNWNINNSADVRLADIKFVPTSSEVVAAYSDVLHVEQEAAEPIVPDTRKGDSLALLNIAQTMQCWNQYDTSVAMDSWSGITLWNERMKGCKKEWVGRVKRVEIFLCNAFEGLPYEVKYLTAADEIYIFSNENSMLKNIDLFEKFTSEDPLKLDNLKRLTVAAFGVSKFTIADNVSMANLEFLDLGSNNFQKVPEAINPENFPRLHALVLNAQQRHAVSDLSNTVYTTEALGGLIEEPSFPERLLLWESESGKCLDTLVLSVNYLHGALPSFEGRADVPTWSEAEVVAADTLPRELIGVPKVLPTTKTFRINHNRLSGEAPKWLMMHPALDWWVPFSLIFPQEGRFSDGTKAGFTNEPPSLVEYYTKWYPNKKLADSIEEDTSTEEDGTITK
ncbi:MAG: BACON domain-containing protein [Alistipes sp.]|nr:BACON domain-containing protein [Alistipes sp.]